jgi:hypothetical protein
MDPELSTQSLILGLVRDRLGLDFAHASVFNQKWKLPTDDGLFLSVASMGPDKSYAGAAQTREDASGDLLEDVEVNTREMVTIDIYSRDQSAVDRAHEVAAALASVEAQQLCELHSLKIARIPIGPVDLSGLEGAGRLNRKHFVLAVLRGRVVTSIIEHFVPGGAPGLVLQP